MMKVEESRSRRQFLNGLMRYPLMLAALAAGGKAVLGKDGNLSDSFWLRARRCSDCRLVDYCILPAAKRARRAREGEAPIES